MNFTYMTQTDPCSVSLVCFLVGLFKFMDEGSGSVMICGIQVRSHSLICITENTAEIGGEIKTTSIAESDTEIERYYFVEVCICQGKDQSDSRN